MNEMILLGQVLHQADLTAAQLLILVSLCVCVQYTRIIPYCEYFGMSPSSPLNVSMGTYIYVQYSWLPFEIFKIT